MATFIPDNYFLATSRLSEGTKISISLPISTDLCYEELQQDINSIFQRSVENLMSFNISKYKCMLLTDKRDAFSPTI